MEKNIHGRGNGIHKGPNRRREWPVGGLVLKFRQQDRSVESSDIIHGLYLLSCGRIKLGLKPNLLVLTLAVSELGATGCLATSIRHLEKRWKEKAPLEHPEALMALEAPVK